MGFFLQSSFLQRPAAAAASFRIVPRSLQMDMKRLFTNVRGGDFEHKQNNQINQYFTCVSSVLAIPLFINHRRRICVGRRRGHLQQLLLHWFDGVFSRGGSCCCGSCCSGGSTSATAAVGCRDIFDSECSWRLWPGSEVSCLLKY